MAHYIVCEKEGANRSTPMHHAWSIIRTYLRGGQRTQARSIHIPEWAGLQLPCGPILSYLQPFPSAKVSRSGGKYKTLWKGATHCSTRRKTSCSPKTARSKWKLLGEPNWLEIIYIQSSSEYSAQGQVLLCNHRNLRCSYAEGRSPHQTQGSSLQFYIKGDSEQACKN